MPAYNQSRIKLFRRCQKAYSFRYDYAGHYHEDPTAEMVPRLTRIQFKRGSWMHLLQQAHHRSWAGVPEWEFEVRKSPTRVAKYTVSNWQDVHVVLTDEFNQLFDEEKEMYGPLPDECYRMMRNYMTFWKDDADQYKPAMLKDGTPAVEFLIEVPLSQFDVEYPFKGQVDLLVEDQEYGGLWIWDAKWVKSLPNPDERIMSPQSYVYPWGLLKMDYDIRGFLYNYGRTKPPTEPDVLKKGFLTTKPSLDSDVYTYTRAIVELHGREQAKELIPTYYAQKLRELKAREKDWFRRERIPVEMPQIKQAMREFLVTINDIQRREPDNPPRTYDYRCKFSCDYHSLCVAEFMGLDAESLIKADYTFEEERYATSEIES